MIRIKVAPVLYIIFFTFVLMTSIWGFESRYITILNSNISYTDILLIIISGILLPLLFKGIEDTGTADKAARYFYFIVFYCFVSLLWAESKTSSWYIIYQILLAFVTILIPHLLSKLTNDKYIDYEKVIGVFSFALTLLFFYYYLGRTDGRLGGYLGGAALIGFVMIPVAAVHFNNIMERKRIIISSVAFVTTVFCIFMTQSRMALLIFILYMLITLFRKPTIVRISLSAIIGIASYFIFADKINTFRYANLTSDNSREIMLDSAINWGTHDAFAFIFGNGYGSLWQWAAYLQGDLTWFQKFQPTEHGYIMYHAHSIFNQLFAETGFIGLLPFILFVYLLIKETYKSWKNKEEFRLNLLIAILCTIPATFSDLILFVNWQVSLVWFFFAFTVLNYRQKDVIGKTSKTFKIR